MATIKVKLEIAKIGLITAQDGTVKIIGSRHVRSPKAINAALLALRGGGDESALRTRSVRSLAREWMAHNLLHSMGIKPERTADVDFETAQPWHLAAGYFMLAAVYRALWRVL